MKSAVQFALRQSGALAFALFVLGLANAAYVCEGLWQGNGLHGYTVQHLNKYNSAYVVSTWAAFIQMLVSIGLAGVLLVVNRRGVRHGLKPEAPKYPASRGRKTKTRGQG